MVFVSKFDEEMDDDVVTADMDDVTADEEGDEEGDLE